MIPGNDDAIRSCQLVIGTIGGAIETGAGAWRVQEEKRIAEEMARRKKDDEERKKREEEEKARVEAEEAAKKAAEAEQLAEAKANPPAAAGAAAARRDKGAEPGPAARFPATAHAVAEQPTGGKS